MSTRRQIIKRTFKHEILNAILSGAPAPAVLYHYTDQSGLLGIVKRKEIWATHHQCLNDTQEYLHAKGLVRGEVDRQWKEADPENRLLFEAMRSILDGPGNEDVNLYVASFSEDGDSLPQWRAYGGQTAGFALGFWGYRMGLPEGFTLARCIYEAQEQIDVVRAIVEEAEQTLAEMPPSGPSNVNFVAKATLLSTLHEFALILKHEKFREEREWRIISRVLMDVKPAYKVGEDIRLEFRPGKSMLVPYWRVSLKDLKDNFPLPLSEIVVGPNPNPQQSVRSVRSLLNSQGFMATNVRSSNIPYRNW